MVAPGIIDTPRAEHQTESSIDIEAELGSRMDTFMSPGGDLLRPGTTTAAASRSRARQQHITPAREIFGSIANRGGGGGGKVEFTPLLKSVQKSNLSRRVGSRSGGGLSTPSFMKAGKLDSPALPHAGSSDVGDSTYQTRGDDETTTIGPIGPGSSVDSTPIAPVPRGKGGVLEHDGQMTLREQEQIINDIKKENFGLKLKIVFMEERVKKLGPEYHDEAIKENIEIKVERATLKAELNRYRRSLIESEKAIAALRDQMMGLQNDKQRKYADSRRSEEQARALLEADGKLEAKENELQQLVDENDRLREEVESYKGKVDALENEDNEVEELRKEVNALEAEKADLEADLSEKERLLEELEEEMEGVEDGIKQRDERIKDLEGEAESLQEQVATLEREREEREGGRNEDLAKKGEALRRAEQKIKDMEKGMLDLRNALGDEKAARMEIVQDKERLEAKNEQLQMDKANINADKEGLREEVKRLRDEARNRSFTYKGRIEERDGKGKIQAEIEQLRREYDDLHLSHQEKMVELGRLQARLEERDGDFDTEFKSLQKQVDNLKREKESVMRSRSGLESELARTKADISNLKSEKDLAILRHDALTDETQGLQKQVEKLKTAVQEANAALQQEREIGASNEQALKRDWDDDRNTMSDELDRLENEIRERDMRHERAVADWNSEKKQLESKIQRAETTMHGLKNTIGNLQRAEHSVQGKEARLQNVLKSESERHKAEEEALHKQIMELQDEIEDKKTSLDVKAAELNAIKEELRVTKKSEKALDEKVRSLDDEVELLSAQLDEVTEEAEDQASNAKAELESLRQKLNTTKLELTRVENQNAAARSDIQTFKGDLEVASNTQSQLKADLKESNRRLEAVQKEKHHLQDQLAKVNSQVSAVRSAFMEVEAERDELKSQLQRISRQVDVTKGFDQERMELRKSKSKLELTLQRTTDEREVLEQRANELEARLEEAIIGAQDLEDKLEKQSRDLKTQLKAISDSREHDNQVAQRKIARLESRIEDQLKAGRQDGNPDEELTNLRAELTESRKRESDSIQKEAANKRVTRELRLQIDKLEGELLEAKNAAAVSLSPNGRTPRTGRKSEVEEFRRQLAAAHDQVRELRSQTRLHQRELEDQKAAYDQVEYEKSLVDQEIDEIREANDGLVAKNLQTSTMMADLRKRVLMLEKELHGTRLNKQMKNSDRTAQEEAADERQELHDHIKAATLDIEQLQSQLNARDDEIRGRRKREKELESQVKTLRKEKQQLDNQASGIGDELKKLARRYQRAVERAAQVQAAWDEERKTIKQRVRFSESTSRREHAKTDFEVKALEKLAREADDRHRAEIKGLAKQIRYLRAKVAREASFRADLSFSKNFFLMQINLYSACNEANMQLIEQMGIFPSRYEREKRPALRSVIHTVIAIIRMRKLQRSWSVSKDMRTSLVKSLERMRRMESIEV